ncbi:MAG: SAM-dependent methyltransferase [Candidatus Dojkabacteria bacterium]|nr:SAM-dependent methyltransferase [Candidatus Dojkabacteria bacterium]
MKKGILYLIPTPISGDDLSSFLLPKDKRIIEELDTFVVETAKKARAHLGTLNLKKRIQDIQITELNEHTKNYQIADMIIPLIQGHNMGLMSDAGVPSVADPGYKIVIEAQKKEIEVIPLIGPSSIILALMASGLNGQDFAFNGYLPKENNELRKKIRSLELYAKGTGQTQIFMEAPYRNQKVFDILTSVCESNTYLCIAQNITSKDEFIKTKTIAAWKREKKKLADTPCLFLLNKI